MEIETRRFPVGAEILKDGRTHLRVWAPARQRVAVVHGDNKTVTPLEPETAPEGDGYFSGLVPRLERGGHYAFRLDEDQRLYPDPASRYQPEGPHGPSELVDPHSFRWTDSDWSGVSARGPVIYELHLGTFTAEGTYAAAAERLEHLADVGVTVIELMPVAEFPGRFGWGYDGVDLWAPSHLYGRPDDLRRFVDRAHRSGLGVILDVVYNHFGPDGNYLSAFSPDYFTDRYENEWGAALNFDGPGARPVREYFVENAGYWIDEYHLDGLRLDATQQIFDVSPEHVLTAIAARVRQAGGKRQCLLVAENEPQQTRLVRGSDRGGYGLDALWNDDFHHTAMVALSGRREAYFTDYGGTPQELLSAIRWGYLFQGQRYAWQKARRGTPALDLAAQNFVVYLENHDQVSNTARGARLATTIAPPLLRSMTALMLLAPGTPMLFQGQEFGSTRPFAYFADHAADLSARVKAGRGTFLAQFPSLASPDMQARFPDPSSEATFMSSKLDWSERDRHAEALALHRDLLRLRREDPAFASPRDAVHGALLGAHALLLRFVCDAGDRLLVVNLGQDLVLASAPEPLLAPPLGKRWRTRWSSEDPRYGGDGTPPVDTDEGFRFPAQAALVLEPEPQPKPQSEPAG